MSTKLKVREFDSFDTLPDSYGALLDKMDRAGFFHSEAWQSLLMIHRFPEHHVMRIYTVEESSTGKPLLLFPARYTRMDAAVPRAVTIGAIAHAENYASISMMFDESVGAGRKEVLIALFAWLKHAKGSSASPRADVLRLWPFEVDERLSNDVRTAMANAGFLVQTYTNSYNQFELTEGKTFEEYFSQRSSNQRYNSRRRRRKLEQEGDLQFAMLTGNEDQHALQRAVDDYILVAVRSWKVPNSTVSSDVLDEISLAAKTQCLRLGVLRLNGRAIAAQFWIFSAGVASAVRLNFDEQYRKSAPGVILSNMCIEYLLDVDHAVELDFGYGGDAYKEKWMKQSRYYCGFMAFNTATPKGLAYGAVHILGRTAKRLLRKILLKEPEIPIPS